MLCITAIVSILSYVQLGLGVPTVQLPYNDVMKRDLSQQQRQAQMDGDVFGNQEYPGELLPPRMAPEAVPMHPTQGQANFNFNNNNQGGQQQQPGHGNANNHGGDVFGFNQEYPGDVSALPGNPQAFTSRGYQFEEPQKQPADIIPPAAGTRPKPNPIPFVHLFSKNPDQSVEERGHCNYVSDADFNKNANQTVQDAKCYKLTKSNDRVCLWSHDDDLDDCSVAKAQCLLLNGNFFPAPYCSPTRRQS